MRVPTTTKTISEIVTEEVTDNSVSITGTTTEQRDLLNTVQGFLSGYSTSYNSSTGQWEGGEGRLDAGTVVGAGSSQASSVYGQVYTDHRFSVSEFTLSSDGTVLNGPRVNYSGTVYSNSITPYITWAGFEGDHQAASLVVGSVNYYGIRNVTSGPYTGTASATVPSGAYNPRVVSYTSPITSCGTPTISGTTISCSCTGRASGTGTVTFAYDLGEEVTQKV